MSIENYRLIPPQGWDCFSHHIDLSDLIYDQLIPLVNQGKYSFLNLFAGFGVFKDEFGNSLFILFDDSRKKERIIELRVSQVPDVSVEQSQLLQIIDAIAERFSLEALSID